MADTLWVATRKGLFRLECSGPQQPGRIAQTAFLGSPVTMLLPDARDRSIYAALNLGHFGVKTHRSTDGGDTWTEVATPAYPKTDTGDGPSLVQIWSLEAAGPAAVDGLWALVYRHALEVDETGRVLAMGSTTGHLWTSFDAGESWHQLPHHLPPIYALRFAEN
jgi:hypothetical protein